MKVRYNDPRRRVLVGAEALSCDIVTILHLGRGGVQQDGTLDAYNKTRVEQILGIARDIKVVWPHIEVQVLWTGGHNRAQDRSGMECVASEGGAALAYARTLTDLSDAFTMLAEEISTSTVENTTAAAKLIPADSMIIVATDPLHYLCGKVQFIMALVFPKRKTIFVELPSAPPGTTWKNVVKHLVSTFVTIIGMTGVTRGDATTVQRRQEWLQSHTGH